MRSRSRSTPLFATLSGSGPSASVSGPASGSGLTKTSGPQASIATGSIEKPSLSKSGSRSERGALRSVPSRSYVQAW